MNYVLILVFIGKFGYVSSPPPITAATLHFPTQHACLAAYESVKKVWGDKLYGGQCIEAATGKSQWP